MLTLQSEFEGMIFYISQDVSFKEYKMTRQEIEGANARVVQRGYCIGPTITARLALPRRGPIS